MNVTQLERTAIDAHQAGMTWGQFWDQHGAAICAAEPHDRQRFTRLVRRLLALLTSGNLDGAQAVGDDNAIPGELDDQPGPDATKAARCLWPAASDMERPA